MALQRCTPTPNANHVYLVYDNLYQAYVHVGLSWYDAAWFVYDVSEDDAEQSTRYVIYERVVTKPGTKLKQRIFSKE